MSLFESHAEEAAIEWPQERQQIVGPDIAPENRPESNPSGVYICLT
jgi:hypothetical protein